MSVPEAGVRYAQRVETPATVIGGEAAVITPSDSRLHVLNEVGTWLWTRCDGAGETVAALTAAAVAEFEVDEETARAEVYAFLEHAVACGLLVRHAD